MKIGSRLVPALALAGLLATQPLAALACPVPQGIALSAADSARMQDFLRSRAQGLAEALLSDAASDRALVSGLFAGGHGFIEALPDGDYRCRTIKLGGLLPLTAYDFFACRVSKGGTRIDKTSGSQRFSGILRPAAEAVFYRGALHYGDENPIAYDADPERNQVGCVYRVQDAETPRYRLELPAPRFESRHDIIELVPAG